MFTKVKPMYDKNQQERLAGLSDSKLAIELTTNLNALAGIAIDNVEVIRVKNAQYGGSWKKRGNLSAYENLCRKIDRLQEQVSEKNGYNIFGATEGDNTEPLDDTLMDLSNYCLLILEMRRQIRTFRKEQGFYNDDQDRLSVETTLPNSDFSEGAEPGLGYVNQDR